MSTYDDASLVFYPSGYKADKAYSLKPTDGSGDLTFTRASTATRVNESGLIESVATGVPRIDYTGGGCGKLLLEPQRTNLLLYSELFNNAYWTSGGITITPNSTTSPDGTLNAQKLTSTSYNSVRRILSVSSSTIYTQSFYFKKDTSNESWVQLSFTGGTAIQYGYRINWTSFTISKISGAYTDPTSVSFTSVGNGWYRFEMAASSTNNTSVTYSILPDSSATSSIFAWGAQLELSSYSTSLIKTTTTSVTRVADSLSNFTSAAIFGTASDSVVYFEILHAGIVNTSAAAIFRFGDAGAGLQFSLYVDNKGVNVFNYAAPSGFLINETNANGSTIKIAIRWNGAVLTGFHNGVKKTTITRSSGTYSIDRISDMNMSNLNSIGLKSMIIFPTALTDEELIALTTL